MLNQQSLNIEGRENIQSIQSELDRKCEERIDEFRSDSHTQYQNSFFLFQHNNIAEQRKRGGLHRQIFGIYYELYEDPNKEIKSIDNIEDNSICINSYYPIQSSHSSNIRIIAKEIDIYKINTNNRSMKSTILSFLSLKHLINYLDKIQDARIKIDEDPIILDDSGKNRIYELISIHIANISQQLEQLQQNEYDEIVRKNLEEINLDLVDSYNKFFLRSFLYRGCFDNISKLKDIRKNIDVFLMMMMSRNDLSYISNTRKGASIEADYNIFEYLPESASISMRHQYSSHNEGRGVTDLESQQKINILNNALSINNYQIKKYKAIVENQTEVINREKKYLRRFFSIIFTSYFSMTANFLFKIILSILSPVLLPIYCIFNARRLYSLQRDSARLLTTYHQELIKAKDRLTFFLAYIREIEKRRKIECNKIRSN